MTNDLAKDDGVSMQTEELSATAPLLPTTDNKTKDTSVMMAYSGPLPMPNMVQGYEELLPGSTERILAMAEKEQRMRETETLKLIVSDRIMMGLSFVVSLALISGGVFCAYIGHPTVGGIIATSGAVGGMFKLWAELKGSNR